MEMPHRAPRTDAMPIRYDRIERAQALMREHGMIGLMIMNHDDYRFFFGEVRVQPRAILPAHGPPVLIAFASEEAELRAALGDAPAKLATHVGEQISNVRKTFLEVLGGPPGAGCGQLSGPPKVGMQMWFHTPAFLVDLFRKVNPQVQLVPSDPVMDELRMVKEPEEIEYMRTAQEIAGIGMERARSLLRPGVSGHKIATEVLYAMMEAGAEGTSTPIHVNIGPQSCWVHGMISDRSVEEGDLVVIDLTPQFQGYCANLARTYVVGEPSDWQLRLLETYREMHETTRQALRPGTKVSHLDALGKEICERHDLGEYHLRGISHGIGLRFEETPASTILPAHRAVELREDMTVTVGHTVLAVPGYGGVRFEDVCRITEAGGEFLHPYPLGWTIGIEG